MSDFDWDKEAIPADAAPAAPAAAPAEPAFDWDKESVAAPPAGPTALDAGGRGLVQGGTLGFGDEIAGAVGAPMVALYKRYLQAKGATAATTPSARIQEPALPSVRDEYKTIRDQERQKNDAAEQAPGGAYLAGNLAGGLLPAALVPGGGTWTGAGFAGAGLGAANGIGSDNSDSTKEMLAQGALGTALGGAGGALGHGAGVLLGKVPALLERAGISQGKRAIAGVINSMSSRPPIAGDLAKTFMDQGGVKLGDSVSNIYARAGQMAQSFGEKQGNLLQQIEDAGVAGPNARNDLINKFVEKAQEAARNLNRAGEREFLDKAGMIRTAAEELADENGNVPLTQNEKWKQMLQWLAEDEYDKGKFGSRPLGDAQKAAASIARQATEDAIEKGAPKVGLSPEILDRYNAAKHLTAAATAARGESKSGANRFSKKALIGLRATIYGAGAASGAALGGDDSGGRGGGALKGLAYAGALQAGINRFPATSAVALRGMGKLAARVIGNPQSLGKWGSVLLPAYLRAYQNGGHAAAKQAVETEHFKLAQTDPDYQQHIDSLPDDEDNQDQQP